MMKKKLVTHTEDPKGRNIKSTDKETKKVIPNKTLVEKVKKKELQ